MAKCKTCSNYNHATNWCDLVDDYPNKEIERQCDTYEKMTNADHIRAMTDTELRLFLCEIADCKRCPCHDMCIEYGMGTGSEKWLQSKMRD